VCELATTPHNALKLPTPTYSAVVSPLKLTNELKAYNLDILVYNGLRFSREEPDLGGFFI
jgi:hypothetical protein